MLGQSVPVVCHSISRVDICFGAELCPTLQNRHVFKSEPPRPQNVAVFGDRVFIEVIKLK